MDSESEPLPAAERWEYAKKGRYYLACVQRNLFGDLEVWRAWGGIGSRRGGQQFDPVSDVDSARVRLAAIDRRRRARGYCWSTPRQCTDDSPDMARS